MRAPRKPRPSLGLRIREIRKKIFPVMSDAARNAKVSVSTWNDYEAGRSTPTLERLERIARTLGCTASHLLGEDIDAEAPITIPTWPTGGGIHWQVAEGVEPYDTPIPRGMIGFEVHGDSMEPLARDGQIAIANRTAAPLSPVKIKARTFRLQAIRQAASIDTWPNNAMRHSYATYHLALHQDAPRTAHELGHTGPGMLYRHYRNLATQADARRYFRITPQSLRKVVLPPDSSSQMSSEP